MSDYPGKRTDRPSGSTHPQRDLEPAGKLLSRETVQRTRARVEQATLLLWSENPPKDSPIRRVIDQLTELGDDLLHELQEFDVEALANAETEAQIAADGLTDALEGVRDKHAIIAERD